MATDFADELANGAEGRRPPASYPSNVQRVPESGRADSTADLLVPKRATPKHGHAQDTRPATNLAQDARRWKGQRAGCTCELGRVMGARLAARGLNGDPPLLRER